MAKTIEERAEEHTKVLRYTMPNSDVGNVLSNLTCKAYKKGYVIGATDQRKIDIEKACGAYCKVCDTKECEEFGYEMCNWLKKFRKELEDEQ